MRKIVSMLFVPAMLTACAMPSMPENAQGMRQMWKEHAGDKWYPQVQTEVPVPFDKAVQYVKNNGQHCLSVTENVSGGTDYGATAHWQNVYTPTMTITGKNAELYLVKTTPGNFGTLRHVPQLTADLAPASATSTKVVIYHLSYDPSQRIAHAIASWAAGKNVGCPDMSR